MCMEEESKIDHGVRLGERNLYISEEVKTLLGIKRNISLPLSIYLPIALHEASLQLFSGEYSLFVSLLCFYWTSVTLSTNDV